MIISRIAGGLGNQMFQYAVGRHLAQLHQTELKLDINWFGSDPTRPYRLNLMNIQECIASEADLRQFPSTAPTLLEKCTYELKKRWSGYLRIEEPHFHYSPEILKAGPNTLLRGFWQTEKYFKPVEAGIRREFTMKTPLAGRDREVAQAMAGSCSVALHVRRGDTVQDPALVKKIGSPAAAYFRRAVEAMAARISHPHFFVFTDDHPWARENILLDFPTTFVDHNDELRNCEELHLMSQAKHFIISNSTFSWWAAWLNRNPAKIVMAPERWFNEAKFDTKDLLPEGWLRV